MGEKLASTTTEVKPSSGDNFVEVWKLSPEEQNEYNLRARGHVELANHYQQGREIREQRARDREDPHGTREWDERGARMAAETGVDPRVTPETAVESPKREGLLRRLGSRFVRKPAEPNTFEQRDKNGW